MAYEKIDDSKLVSMINAEISQARTNAFDLISDQRIDSNYAFSHQQTSNTRPTTGMSQARFFFTHSCVQTLTMNLSKVFASKKDTFKLIPSNKSAENMKAAEQLEQAVNAVFHRENNGFEVITSLLRSAAVNKNGIAKTTWNDHRVTYEEDYEDITEYELQSIIEDKENQGYKVDVVESIMMTEGVSIEDTDVFTGETTSVTAVEERGSYTLRFEKMEGRIDIDVLPPEDFIINEDTTSINNDNLTRFIGHRKEMLRGEVMLLIEALGSDFNIDDLVGGIPDDDEYETQARHDVDGTLETFYNITDHGTAAEKVTILESWVRADRDGDGYPEWRHVYSDGQSVIFDEEWYGPIPFTSYTYFPIPHKFYGQSVWDVVRTYDEQATGLFRSDLDLARLKNTFRVIVKDGVIDKRELQSGKPGPITASNKFDPTSLFVVPTPQGANNSIQLLQEIRRNVIGEIGIDPITGQISTDIEKSGNDAAKTSMALDNANIKVEGYSRRFADGPMRDICWTIAVELVRHKDSKFVRDIIESVTPGEPFHAAEGGFMDIVRKVDFTSKVGLGHQTGQQKIAASQIVGGMLAQLQQDPNPAIYNLVSETLDGHGYESPESIIGPLDFWMQKAAEMKQQQQMAMQAQQQQVQIQQQQLQLQQQQFQFESQLAMQKQEFEKQIMQQESDAKIEQMRGSGALSYAKADSEPIKTANDVRKTEADIELTREQGTGVMIS